MEINVGDYVRTKFDEIGRVVELCGKNSCGNLYKLDIKEQLYSEGNITKHSKDIIDLIEVGDYVNGCYVTNRSACHNDGIILIPKRIGIIKCNAYFNQGSYSDCSFQWIENEDIKSVLTKQQFEANAYTIEKER